MATFNPLDPSTFRLSAPSKTGGYAPQTSNFAYQVSVLPSDPATYQGPLYVTISSSTLLNTDEILNMALAIVKTRGLRSSANQDVDVELVDGQINRSYAEGLGLA